MATRRTHRDQPIHRIRLRPETVKQVRLLALLMGRDNWHVVADDALRVGIAYLNHVYRLEMAEWESGMELPDLNSDLKLNIFTADLPPPDL